MRAAVLLQQLLGDVDRVLDAGVVADVLEDVDRLQRLAEGAAALAQALVGGAADGGRVLVPEVGEQVTDGARDVVAVLAELLDRLDADAVGVELDELAHPGDHLGHPAAHDGARARGEREEVREDEVRVADEGEVRGVAGDRGGQRREAVGRGLPVEAVEQGLEQRGLLGGRHPGRVLDRVGEAADEVGREDGLAEVAGERADPDREGARDGGEDQLAEAAGVAVGDGVGEGGVWELGHVRG